MRTAHAMAGRPAADGLFCLFCSVLQYGELPEQAAFGEEFCKSMSFFTRHSLTGGTISLKVGGHLAFLLLLLPAFGMDDEGQLELAGSCQRLTSCSWGSPHSCS